MTVKVYFPRNEEQNRNNTMVLIFLIHPKLCLFSPTMSSQDPGCSLSSSSWAGQPSPLHLFSQSRCVGAKGPELTNGQKCPLSQQPTGSGTQGGHRAGIVSTVSARSSGQLALSTNQSQMRSGSEGSGRGQRPPPTAL